MPETPNPREQQDNQEQPSYPEMLERIEEVLEEGEAEKREFINDRVEQLTAESDPSTMISLLSNDVYQGFLHPEAEINRNLMMVPFHVNDRDIYEIVLDKIEKFEEHYDDRNIREVTPLSVQYALSEYFGNVYGYKGCNENNKRFYTDRSTIDPSSDDEGFSEIDLEEFKGEDMAVCAEKAATAQNLLSFLGIDSYLISSSNCEID